MKILLVNYEFAPQCGGAGLGTYNMARAFQRMGHEVTLLIGWDFTYGIPEKIEKVETYSVSIHKKNIHQSSACGMLAFLIKGMPLIHKLTKKKKYDIIQFYFSVPTGILKYGISGNIPYVISLRGLDIPGFRNDRYKYLNKVTNYMNYRVAKGSAAVTSLSYEAGKKYTEFAPDIRIDVIPNAVEYEMYHVKKEYAVNITKFVAVSRLTGFKNLDILIKAFVKVRNKGKNISLDIYGEGGEREKLQRLIGRFHADTYIQLKGYADQTELIKILPSYDMFSLVSIGDSFGMVYIEAMAAGLPVLCAAAGGPLEIVSNCENGFIVAPNDVEDTVRGIEYCITNPEQLAIWGRNARKQVEEKYSIESVAREHIKLYKNILGRG